MSHEPTGLALYDRTAQYAAITAAAASAFIAVLPAIICRLLLPGAAGQITSAIAFLAVFGLEWQFYFRRKQS